MTLTQRQVGRLGAVRNADHVRLTRPSFFLRVLRGAAAHYICPQMSQRLRSSKIVQVFKPLRTSVPLLSSLVLAWQPVPGFTQQNSQSPQVIPQRLPTQQDGRHDFDFEIGHWKTNLSRLLHSFTGTTTWVKYDGTSVVRKVWNGRANLLELEADGSAGHIEGLSLRLYNPRSNQWSLYFSNGNQGGLGQPTVGGFKNGRGEFFDQETFNDRAIYVRFVISDITANSCHFEQAFSDDGGKSWEVNWIATDTRIKDAAE